MKLRDKECGLRMRYTTLPDNRNLKEIKFYKYVNQKQYRKMTSRPENLHQFAHWIADRVEAETDIRPRVYAECNCSLNYRPSLPLIDPTMDLAAHPLWKWPYPFVTELPELPPELKAELPWNWDWKAILTEWKLPVCLTTRVNAKKAYGSLNGIWQHQLKEARAARKKAELSSKT